MIQFNLTLLDNTQLECFVYQFVTIPQPVLQLLDKELMLPITKLEIRQNVLFFKWPSEWDLILKNSELNKIN